MQDEAADKILDSEMLSTQLKRIHSPGHDKHLIVSCYLDTREGKATCRHFVDQQLDHYRLNKRYSPAFIQHMKQSLQDAIERHWHPDAKAMAIFTSDGYQPLFEVMHLQQAVPSRQDVYTRANILPLLALQDAKRNMTLLSLIDGVIQVHDVDLGRIRTRGWAAAPHLSAESGTKSHRKDHSGVDKRLQLICQSLLSSRSKPLVLAANPSDLKLIKSWLPQIIAWNLQESIELPYDLRQAAFNDYMLDYFIQQQQSESDRSAASLQNALKLKGAAVAGPLATLQALRVNQVTRLLIAENPVASSEPEFISHWNPVIEASWLAYGKNIPVVQLETAQLGQHGGMACMIRKPCELAHLPIPATAKLVNLDLVA